MDKVNRSAAEAVGDSADHASLAVGGFGLDGVPNALVAALHARGVHGPGIVSDNPGTDGSGAPGPTPDEVRDKAGAEPS
ncbi:CoA-transferase [Streptomyces marianii]|uniref:CoA transferase n=1 Tax=Streptomyces marianii TaxID=1817406 RepID=A0A5R9E946_9ACTN|nr:CoA-transferase [Streptomyces marianii]TLQ44734.1 hypothetical protein FEF34_18025 [Streptomyces marianii]